MVSIMGGCNKCGRLSTLFTTKGENIQPLGLGGHLSAHGDWICRSCYDEYYSPEAIRNSKIEKLLRVPWYKRIM